MLERVLLLLMGTPIVAAASLAADEKDQTRRLDPAAWGHDHVGKPLPDYVTGDECLFCHRQIGPSWADNRHQLTIRPASPDAQAVKLLDQLAKGKEIAAETRYLMGSRRIGFFVRRSKEYGKLDLLKIRYFPPAEHNGHLMDVGPPHWDTNTFADRCAGCHTTAVNTRTRQFSATSLDCFSCHGDVDLAHTEDTSLVLFSKTNRDARQLTSTCGQCHLRGGESKSSGLPYPNTFVAGDNLFRDFQVDFDEALLSAPPIDRHIIMNARDVAVFGKTELTCLSCHDIHGQSPARHEQLDNTAICCSCHVTGSGNTQLRAGVRAADRQRICNRVCDF